MIVQNIKAVFDIAKENRVDLNVGLFMYRNNEANGFGKYRGAGDDFDWDGDTNIDDEKWNALMRSGYDALTKARREGNEKAFADTVNKYYV